MKRIGITEGRRERRGNERKREGRMKMTGKEEIVKRKGRDRKEVVEEEEEKVEEK